LILEVLPQAFLSQLHKNSSAALVHPHSFSEVCSTQLCAFSTAPLKFSQFKPSHLNVFPHFGQSPG